MKVFIAGGTGFIGYHTCVELISRGYDVATLSLPDIDLGNWFPSEARVSYGDLFTMSAEDMHSLFSGFDALIYAVGPDDRVTPKAPAYDFFHERLVEACRRIAAAARQAGIKKMVLTNSYFAYFDREMPELNLAGRHPYIGVRVKQADAVINEGAGKMDVMVLELPYIFGAMPERVPLWKDILIRRLHESPVVYYPRGGSVMVSVRQVAKAAAGALINGIHGRRYPVGDRNLEWNSMIRIMLDEMNMGHKKIRNVPAFLMNMYGRKLHKEERRNGLESGLNLRHLFHDIQCRNLFYDATESKRELGYDGGDLEESIRETVRACMPV